MLKSNNSSKTTQNKIIPLQNHVVQENDDYLLVSKNNIEESIPILEEIIYGEQDFIPFREVTFIEWNGPILYLEGFYYLEGLPIKSEEIVKKKLVLVNQKQGEFTVPLRDKRRNEQLFNFDNSYLWSGFEGEVDLSKITKNSKPLPDSIYNIYLDIEIQQNLNKVYSQRVTLGNIEEFFKQGFHSAKMEYFSAKKQMKYNLLATYNVSEKTMQLRSKKLKDFNPSKENDKTEVQKSKFYRFFNSNVFRFLYSLFKLFPINANKVLFASDSRTEMDGNFKYVYDEMLRQRLNYKYKFMLKSSISEKKSYSEIIQLAYNLATSKYIMLDDFYPMVYPLKIREKAELIQLWHAVGAFKTFGFSRVGLPGGPSSKSKNHRNYTKAIVSSKNIAKHYAEGFGIDNENVVSTGIPRTDVFFNQEYQLDAKEQFYKEFPYLRDKKIILFAPTFRGNGQQSAHYPIEVLNLEKMYNDLSEEYVFLFKLHPFVKNDITIPYQFSDFYFDFSSYREVNNLLFVSDILITDYSSVCFEYALLKKPMLFFAFDVETYVQQRDFYFNYQSFIPGTLVRNTSEIVGSIQNRHFNQEKLDPFVNYFFDNVDGNSSRRVVEQLLKE